jgi:uncharacterized protein YqeY
MALLDKIQKDMVEAMKSKDEARLGALRMVKSALKKHEIDAMKPLGAREELALKEEAEIRILESYLPSGATPAELEAAIAAAIAETGATSAKQMGLVMKTAQAKLAGKRVDGRALSDLVKARLA